MVASMSHPQLMPSHCWRVGSLQLHISVGDLFTPEVDAIVNSEQTNFVLTSNPSTISGQIWGRFGEAIQAELDEQTKWETLPPGTVLTTGGGQRYRRIYHAGFHRPGEWLSENDRDQEEGDALRTISRCVGEILARVDGHEVRSVAFPLLGTGLFGLDPAVVAYEFARQAASVGLGEGVPDREVWLVLRSDAYPRAIDAAIQGVIDAHQAFSAIGDLQLGISFLDSFNRRQVHSGDPRFLGWMLTRYTELLVSYLMFRLAVEAGDEGKVERLLSPGKSLSFGAARVEAQNLALRLRDRQLPEGWPCFIREKLLKDMHSAHRLLRINDDRNQLAHGRQARSAAEIEADLRAFVGGDEWAEVRRDYGDPEVDRLDPWVRLQTPASGVPEPRSGSYGILDRRTPRFFEYLVPASGQTFRCPAA